ncbi:MAG: acyloxyacyl hydrolase [Deltaproteobacteria bacterium]|nr:acyloxyacyl hydrolase [Deltaproteobacteria bacterium]
MSMFVFGNALRNFWYALMCFLLIGIFPQNIQAGEDNSKDVPNRYGLAMIIGNTYDPSGNTGFVLLSGFALFDYDKIWQHAAPAPLRFKVEASVGSTWTKEKEFMASAGILALYFLDRFNGHGFRPYVEAGIGGIYTEWKVEGQGSHLNFNPQIGIGTEFSIGSDPPFFAAVRLHHISNAGLKKDNRGSNSVVFVIGRFF